MSLETLNAMHSSVQARIRAPHVKARSPLDMAQFGTGFESTAEYDTSQQEDQYAHYRGRFYSAARLIVSRVASQPVLAARVGVRNKSRSLKEMVQKGFVPPGMPAWLGDPEGLEVLTQHPVLTAFEDPNPHMTRYNVTEILLGSLMATGRGFLVALPSETKGRALDLWPIPTTWMKPVGNKWEIRPPDSAERPVEVDNAQVAQCYFADPRSVTGAISPLAMVARSVLADEAISAAQYAEFKNGPVPKVALIAGDVNGDTSFMDDTRTTSARPVRLEPQQRRQIVTWFQQQFAGVQKHGLPIVLDAIIRDVKILSRKPSEMAFLESAGLTKEQIFEAVGVSKILTGQLEGVTRASGGLAEQMFVDNCLNPVITLISQVLTKKFGPLFAVGGETLKVWIAEALARDTELDVELLTLGVRSYSVNRNEVRSILRKRFGGLPWLAEFENVIIPQTLDTRGEGDDWMGIGRLALAQQDQAPVNGERRFVNGFGRH